MNEYIYIHMSYIYIYIYIYIYYTHRSKGPAALIATVNGNLDQPSCL